MLIKYIGHRPFITQTFNHKQILFDKSNKFTQDITDQDIMVELLSTGNFAPTVPDTVKEAKKVEKVEKVDTVDKEFTFDYGVKKPKKKDKKV